MEKKKKQFVRPTVRLLEDVDALPLLAGSDGSDDVIGFTSSGDDGAKFIGKGSAGESIYGRGAF